MKPLFDESKLYTFTYGGHNFYIPKRMESGIELYIKKGIMPGSFLTAVICNDLQGAVGAADSENIHNLPAYVSWFYNEAPHNCWGSKERMHAWVGKFFQGEELDD